MFKIGMTIYNFFHFPDDREYTFTSVSVHIQAAFSNCYVVDNGESVVATGGRSASSVRGLGLMSKIMPASMGAAMANFPHLKRFVSTAVDSDFYDKYKKPNPEGVVITYKRVS